MSVQAAAAPALVDLVEGVLMDDASPGAPTRASLDGCDEARARAELVARLGRGAMSLRERAAALMLAERVGVDGQEEALAALIRDPSLPPSSRSCAMMLLMTVESAEPRLRALAQSVGEETWRSLHDEKLTLSLALQMPAPEVAEALAAQLARCPEGVRDEVFARMDRCRRAAGLPALLAWRRALAAQELAAQHDRMAAAVADEAGGGAEVVLEALWRAADDEAVRARLGRVVAQVEARALRGSGPGARGVAHRIESPGAGAEWMVCVAHPGRMTLVARAREPEGEALRVDSVHVMPSEPSVQIGAAGAGPLTMSYRTVSLAETRERAVAAARALRAGERELPHELCVLLCLLDGLPSVEARPDVRSLD